MLSDGPSSYVGGSADGRRIRGWSDDRTNKVYHIYMIGRMALTVPSSIFKTFLRRLSSSEPTSALN